VGDGEDGFAKGFTDAGGEMLGGVQFPPANPDFAPFVQRIKDAKPDVVFVFVPGGKQATGFMKAWTDFGLAAAGVKLVGTQDIVTDDELPNMGDAPLGIVTSGIYSVAGKRPQNQALLDAWTKEYGAAAIANYVAAGMAWPRSST
jgi:branched-chain amino acid transport system substrate-binding protein